VDPVGESHPRAARVEPQRRPPAGALALGALGGGQLAAGAGIEALGKWAVLRLRRGADLGAGAPAGVGAAVRLEPRYRLVVKRPPLRLALRLAVPVDPDRAQVGELAGLLLAPRALRVEVLDPEQEPAARGAREQPREQRGAEVPEVELAGGAGCVAAGQYPAGCRTT
jgi:hypothetical protein